MSQNQATLAELRAAAVSASAVLREAEDRLGQAKDTARASIALLASLEQASIDRLVDEAAMQAARDARDAALADLATIEATLDPRPANGRDTEP